MRSGVPLDVARSVQRVIAALAIVGGPIARSRLAGTLWMDVSERRARGNLRSALWRLGDDADLLVHHHGDLVALSPSVEVDVARLTALAESLVHANSTPALPDLRALIAASDLLPGWDEEWLLFERERFRQLRLHALECACERLTLQGNFVAALDAVLASLASEPLRESAHRLLVSIHLAEGNLREARRQYVAYCRLAEVELGVGPSVALSQLIAI